MLVGTQLGGDRAPVGGHRRDHHDLTHLKFLHLVAHRHDLAQTFVAQGAVGGKTVDGYVVDVRGTGGDQQGAEDPVKAGGLGDLLFSPPGLSAAQRNECFHQRETPAFLSLGIVVCVVRLPVTAALRRPTPPR